MSYHIFYTSNSPISLSLNTFNWSELVKSVSTFSTHDPHVVTFQHRVLLSDKPFSKEFSDQVIH